MCPAVGPVSALGGVMQEAMGITMERGVVVTDAGRPWIEDLPVEIAERKGLGHPDSLCDGMAERISLAYTQWCVQHVGTVLHHNFDKVQLVAGQVDVGFGRGEMLKPIHVQIAGRGTAVTPDGHAIPVDTIAIQAAKDHLRETVRHLDPDRHCVVDCFAGTGASELVHVVERVTSNDTSFGVAHWPLSGLEQTVYQTTRFINEDLLNRFPIGEDVKVMGARLGETVQLTCAVPFLCTAVASLDDYLALKTAVTEAIQNYALAHTTRQVITAVNAADDEDSGDVYLTLTGTSAECGDDGAVGRGNRVTGLITPFRAMSLEAAAGKNPVSHAGKLYNVLALLAAQAIVNEVTGVRGVEVVVLSQIGHPLEEPLVANAAVHLTDGVLRVEIEEGVTAVLCRQLATIDQVRQKIIQREVSLF